jgi:hypothetical protein
MTPSNNRGTATGLWKTAGLVLLLGAAVFAAPLRAQAGPTITIRMFDGRTAEPLTPSNLLVRIDHQDEIRNESLHIGDDGAGQITLPASATFLSAQGTFDNSMEIYFNCDAGMQKNAATLHWYSIAEILSTGVIAPNECYKGKYERNPRINAKPGEFDFFVRKASVTSQFLK